MGSIILDNVGKAYKHYESQWGRLAEWLFPWGKRRHQENWVLQEVSFGVMPGEAVGIVGINGAGKSTLLKIITGTTRPSTGHVRLEGQVAGLLELGMGFHPDFTGRQNVVMAGQLLGLAVDEITALMPEIEAFAERWAIARALNEDKQGYREIAADIGSSTTTVARVARFLKQENYGGYRLVLSRMEEKTKK